MVMVECSLRSLRTVDSHVVFGLPVGRFTGLMKCRKDCLAGVSGGIQGFMWVRLYKSYINLRVVT